MSKGPGDPYRWVNQSNNITIVPTVDCSHSANKKIKLDDKSPSLSDIYTSIIRKKTTNMDSGQDKNNLDVNIESMDTNQDSKKADEVPSQSVKAQTSEIAISKTSQLVSSKIPVVISPRTTESVQISEVVHIMTPEVAVTKEPEVVPTETLEIVPNKIPEVLISKPLDLKGVSTKTLESVISKTPEVSKTDEGSKTTEVISSKTLEAISTKTPEVPKTPEIISTKSSDVKTEVITSQTPEVLKTPEFISSKTPEVSKIEVISTKTTEVAQKNSWTSNFLQSIGVNQKNHIRLNLSKKKTGISSGTTANTSKPLLTTDNNIDSKEEEKKEVLSSGNSANSKLTPSNDNGKKLPPNSTITSTASPIDKSSQYKTKTTVNSVVNINNKASTGINNPKNITVCNELVPQIAPNTDYSAIMKPTGPPYVAQNSLPRNKERTGPPFAHHSYIPRNMDPYRPQFAPHYSVSRNLEPTGPPFVPHSSVPLHAYNNYSDSYEAKIQHNMPQHSTPYCWSGFSGYPDHYIQNTETYIPYAQPDLPLEIYPSYSQNASDYHSEFFRRHIQNDVPIVAQPRPSSAESIYLNYSKKHLETADQNHRIEERITSTYKMPKPSESRYSDSESDTPDLPPLYAGNKDPREKKEEFESTVINESKAVIDSRKSYERVKGSKVSSRKIKMELNRRRNSEDNSRKMDVKVKRTNDKVKHRDGSAESEKYTAKNRWSSSDSNVTKKIIKTKDNKENKKSCENTPKTKDLEKIRGKLSRTKHDPYCSCSKRVKNESIAKKRTTFDEVEYKIKSSLHKIFPDKSKIENNYKSKTDSHKIIKEKYNAPKLSINSNDNAVEDLHKHSNVIKSVVQKIARHSKETNHNDKNHEQVESILYNRKRDLREKISHKTLGEYFRRKSYQRKISNNDIKRDNLVISVPNETKRVDTEGRHSAKRKKNLNSNSRKAKKIKLVINIDCNSDENSSDNSDDNEGKDSDDSSDLDLTFLDSINIDEIVSCLKNHNDEKGEITAEITNEKCLTNCANEVINETLDDVNRSEANSSIDGGEKNLNENANDSNTSEEKNLANWSDETTVEIADNTKKGSIISYLCKSTIPDGENTSGKNCTIPVYPDDSVPINDTSDSIKTGNESKDKTTEILIWTPYLDNLMTSVSNISGYGYTINNEERSNLLETKFPSTETLILSIKEEESENIRDDMSGALSEQENDMSEYQIITLIDDSPKLPTLRVKTLSEINDDLTNIQQCQEDYLPSYNTNSFNKTNIIQESYKSYEKIQTETEFQFDAVKTESLPQLEHLSGDQNSRPHTTVMYSDSEKLEIIDLTDEPKYVTATSEVTMTGLSELAPKCDQIPIDTIDLTEGNNSSPLRRCLAPDESDSVTTNASYDDDLDVVEKESAIVEADDEKKHTLTSQINAEVIADTKVENTIENRTQDESSSDISVKDNSIAKDVTGNKTEDDMKKIDHIKVEIEVDSKCENPSENNTKVRKEIASEGELTEPNKNDYIEKNETGKPPEQGTEVNNASGTVKEIKHGKIKSRFGPIVSNESRNLSPKRKQPHDHFRKIEYESMLPEDKQMVKKLEDHMLNFLKEDLSVTAFIRKGRYSKIYQCSDSRNENYVVKICMKREHCVNSGIEKWKMLKKIQKDIPKENDFFPHLINGFRFDSSWCLLMEYCSKNLVQVLAENKSCLHIAKVQMLTHQLVTALTVLKNNQIVHADLKSAHILLNSTVDRLKICGFDSAFHYKGNEIYFSDITTPNYRAPEVIMGYPAGYCIDVWAAALVIYEMATGDMFVPLNIFNNNHVLFRYMTILGHMPVDMIECGQFAMIHFDGIQFIRMDMTNNQRSTLIPRPFYKTDSILKSMKDAYYRNWGHFEKEEKRLDHNMLIKLNSMLLKMLEFNPNRRLLIELAFSDPFIRSW